MPKVSVVIPAYESEAFLSGAIESVLRQTFDDLELIVVDDGSSTRAAEAIVEGLGEKSPISIRYVYQENRGVSAARNRGLAETTGEFVAFLDSDDEFEKGKLSQQVALLDSKAKEFACVCGGRRIRRLGDRPTIDVLPSPADGSVYGELVTDRLTIGGTGGFLYRRSALAAIGAFDESLQNNEDLDLILRLARLYSIATHPDIVFQSNERAGSLSSSNPARSLSHVLHFIDKLERDDPDLPTPLLQRKRQRAFFNAAQKLLVGQADFSGFRRAMGEGVRCAGLPKNWRGRCAYLFSRSGPLGSLLTGLLFRPPGSSKRK